MSLSKSESPVLPESASATAVIYLRVSTKEQAERGGEAEGFSIPAQRQACYRKAEALGASVVEEFVDRGESARSADRPELQRLLQFLRQQPITYVVVHKVDPLARSRADDVMINLAIQQAGARLVSVSENIDETPSGMLLHGIMSSIAEFYSRNLGAEVSKGLVQKAAGGGTTGRAPVGYQNVIRSDHGRELRTVELDPERAPLMRWAFEAYAGGDWTLRGLLTELTARGLTTRPSKARTAKPLVLSHFTRLLKHPYYKGVVRYRGVEYPGRHEPLVSAELWQAVQDRLSAQGYAGEKQRLHHHYLKGSVFCGRCGSRLLVDHKTNRHGTRYEYFICAGRHERRTDCRQRALPIDVVEDLVEQEYQTIRLDAAAAAELQRLLRQEFRAANEQLVAERARQQHRREQLQAEREKLLQAFYAGALPLDLLRSEQERISRELAIAAAYLQDADERLQRVLGTLDDALALAQDCYRAYALAEPKLRRQFNQVFFAKLLVFDDESVNRELAEPFRLLLAPEVQRDLRLRSITIAELQALSHGWQTTARRPSASRQNEPLTASAVRGSRNNYLVELRGLEPLTPTLPGRRSRSRRFAVVPYVDRRAGSYNGEHRRTDANAANCDHNCDHARPSHSCRRGPECLRRPRGRLRGDSRGRTEQGGGVSRTLPRAAAVADRR
ncbi:recombinase family protein [Geodermatophilus bullaregiensis]|uniref:recombinase family protein n=1 Tax=Geodermatophilus bullaregiensis TaxID=1564160 RepID=UPI001959B723|nr:recombinase family protein [Geodermatophilus bullaregiensis]